MNGPFRRLALAPVYVVLTLCAVVMALPFAWIVTSSLKTKQDFFTSRFLPAGDGFLGVAWDRLTLANYTQLFTQLGIPRALLNSLFYASVTSVLATLCCAMGGYALAKYEFRGRGLLTAIVLAALIIPPPLLLAPGYKLLWQLGLLNSYAGLILPALTPAFGVFLFRQAMLNGVPSELIDAARIDGAGEGRIFFTVALPLVRPMMGAFLLITFVGAWNNFIGPQVILQTPELFPLSVALNNLKGVYGTEYGLITAGTVVSVAPVMCLFLLLQREFISGLTAGAVKG
ncbi:MAG TPA: carbohydrate ABC transporter permease [Opitutaceae bacterium]|nr:carbohydrate ABC transporter permease [Opitutaceae bacterium]